VEREAGNGLVDVDITGAISGTTDSGLLKTHLTHPAGWNLTIHLANISGVVVVIGASYRPKSSVDY